MNKNKKENCRARGKDTEEIEMLERGLITKGWEHAHVRRNQLLQEEWRVRDEALKQKVVGQGLDSSSQPPQEF